MVVLLETAVKYRIELRYYYEEKKTYRELPKIFEVNNVDYCSVDKLSMVFERFHRDLMRKK